MQKYFALKCPTQGAPKAKRLDIRQHALKNCKELKFRSKLLFLRIVGCTQ